MKREKIIFEISKMVYNEISIGKTEEME